MQKAQMNFPRSGNEFFHGIILFQSQRRLDFLCFMSNQTD
jgi:hypothetical protein